VHIGIKAGDKVDFLGQDCGLRCSAGNDLGSEGVEEKDFHSPSFLRGYYPFNICLGRFYCVHVF